MKTVNTQRSLTKDAWATVQEKRGLILYVENSQYMMTYEQATLLATSLVSAINTYEGLFSVQR